MKKSWNEITINDYKRMMEITGRELDSELEKSVGYLSVLAGIPENELWNRNVSDLKSLLKEIEWINNTPFSFNKRWNSKHIKMGEDKYDVVVDINKFTVAQYADFQIYWGHRDDNENMGKLLSVFIIPHGHIYNDGYDMLELIDKIEDNISIADYNSICFFFLKDSMLSIKASLFYSLWLTRKMIRKEKDKEKKEELKKMQKELMTQIRTIRF